MFKQVVSFPSRSVDVSCCSRRKISSEDWQIPWVGFGTKVTCTSKIVRKMWVSQLCFETLFVNRVIRKFVGTIKKVATIETVISFLPGLTFCDEHSPLSPQLHLLICNYIMCFEGNFPEVCSHRQNNLHWFIWWLGEQTTNLTIDVLVYWRMYASLRLVQLNGSVFPQTPRRGSVFALTVQSTVTLSYLTYLVTHTPGPHKQSYIRSLNVLCIYICCGSPGKCSKTGRSSRVAHWFCKYRWPINDESALVNVVAWCRQATSHLLSQCWPRCLHMWLKRLLHGR